jgi:threonine synthase
MDEKTNFNELVAAVAPTLLEGGLNPVSAARVASSAFNFEPELVRLDDDYSLLNLYSGPTGVFKDFGIAFFSAILEELLDKDEKAMIISAASPDTGVSLARAFSGRKGITLVLLYPAGIIRGLDSSTFIQNGGNIIPIQVKGTFDECQRLVIDTIIDQKFSRRYNVTSGNSLNVGRLFPQIFYYLYAFIKIKNSLSGDLIFSVPSGNYSNIIAGLYAWKFGMPVNGFVAAMNSNNAMSEYIKGKPFIPAPVVDTNSPDLDVGFPINFERLDAFYSESPAVMRNLVFPASVDDSLTVKSMEYFMKKYDIFIDPHTAVAFGAAQEIASAQKWKGHAHTIILSTGHPARFADIVRITSGKTVDIPDSISMLNRKCDPIAIIPPHLDAFENAISSCF